MKRFLVPLHLLITVICCAGQPEMPPIRIISTAATIEALKTIVPLHEQLTQNQEAYDAHLKAQDGAQKGALLTGLGVVGTALYGIYTASSGIVNVHYDYFPVDQIKFLEKANKFGQLYTKFKGEFRAPSDSVTWSASFLRIGINKAYKLHNNHYHNSNIATFPDRSKGLRPPRLYTNITGKYPCNALLFSYQPQPDWQRIAKTTALAALALGGTYCIYKHFSHKKDLSETQLLETQGTLDALVGTCRHDLSSIKPNSPAYEMISNTIQEETTACATPECTQTFATLKHALTNKQNNQATVFTKASAA